MSYGWAKDADTHAQRRWQEQTMADPDEDVEAIEIPADVRMIAGYVPMTKELWNDMQSYRAAFGEEPIPWPGGES